MKRPGWLFAVWLCLPPAGSCSQGNAEGDFAPRVLSDAVARNSHGRIQRSQQAKREFRAEHPCPSTGKSRGACPGYVIDHVRPLKRGGEDAPRNMQWQTMEAAKAKDKWE